MDSIRKPILRLAAIAALAASGPAFAGTVGGTVGAINQLADNYVSNIVIVPSVGQTDTEVVYGTIDNNSSTGWRLTVLSSNIGKLELAGSSGGSGREILYTNIKFVKTGGTLGGGLHDPDGAVRNIVTGLLSGGTPGTAVFNSGVAFGTCGTATSATVNYGYSLQISWSADTSLLAGTYTDTLTLTLANDS